MIVAIHKQAAISKMVMPVNLSALPWTICCQSTMTALVGAARKKLLIHPSRTADSAMTTTPKIIPRRQAVTLVVSGVTNSVRSNGSSRCAGEFQPQLRKLESPATQLGRQMSDLSTFRPSPSACSEVSGEFYGKKLRSIRLLTSAWVSGCVKNLFLIPSSMVASRPRIGFRVMAARL